MIAQVTTASICHMQVQMIKVEILVFDGLPDIEVVGDVDSRVRESVKRVFGAIKNAGLKLAPKKVTINFYPADIHKKGSHMDLAIAASVMGAYAYIDRKKLIETVFIGEVGLSGKVLPVSGVLPIVLAAKQQGVKTCYLPIGNEKEAGLTEGIEIIGISSLQEFIQILHGRKQRNQIIYQDSDKAERKKTQNTDFKDVLGQPAVKRAAKIAAAGMHSFLMLGPPGTGKTMTARRILDILPPVSQDEKIELTKVYSLMGLLSEKEPYINERKIRIIRPDMSAKKILGDVRRQQPGEVMLANRGILFMDELSAFSPNILEMIRQPFDDGRLVSELDGKCIEFPADFMLVACMNGCKCGAFPDMTRCTCSISEIRRHAGRISQSFLDRIEICVHFPDVEYDSISKDDIEICTETTDMMRADVRRAFEMQKERYMNTAFVTNRDLTGDIIRKYCRLGKEEESILKKFYETMNLSVRSCHNILKVSRTIADLEGSEDIKSNHLIEAIGLRNIDRSFWKV